MGAKVRKKLYLCTRNTLFKMEDNSLNKYLDSIGRQQLLSDDEERLLSEQIKQGNQRALGRLVESNLRFVVKIASQYRGQGLGLDDLICEGNLAMMSAASPVICFFSQSRATGVKPASSALSITFGLSAIKIP